MPKNMITKFGEPLYTLKDLARASDVPIKVLREWFANGELKSFMTIYEAPSGRRYYRWGAPLYWEIPIHDHIYDLETVVDK
jgi:hypothetical protein